MITNLRMDLRFKLYYLVSSVTMLPRPPAEVPPNMTLCPGLPPTSWLTAARASLRPRY